MKTIKDALIILYSEILESYYTENEFKRLRCYKTFYEFIEIKFEQYKEVCSQIREEEINFLLADDKYGFDGKLTKQRFLNLLNRITEVHLKILQIAYVGNYYLAYRNLDDLMHSRKKISQYLKEMYQNYIMGDVKQSITLYRMRDCKIGDSPKDCWHIPFSKRNRVSLGRFNMSGIPCLYLGDSQQTSDKEIGPLNNNNNRWCSQFKSQRSIDVFDFTIPPAPSIKEENHLHTLLCWLITYPLRLLCSVKTNEDGYFHEEYIFPQLIFHWMYMGTDNKRMSGFMYSSTKNPGGVNYVFPATYETKQPPTYNDKQISERLEKLFTASEPKLYKEGRSRKKYSIEITEL